jgi:hypothetical protein
MSISSTPDSTTTTPLQFEFTGVSVWLELEQIDGDLDRALDIADKDLHVDRILGPHVTVEYGMTHLDEGEMRRRFLQELQPKLHHWPSFRVKGIMTDFTYDGVDGENMSMAWIELTLASSQLHERLVDLVRSIFFAGTTVNALPPRGRWTPHLSLVYENPEQAKSNLHYSLTIMNRVPTLTSQSMRRVRAIALWSTAGQMERWRCLERYELDPDGAME